MTNRTSWIAKLGEPLDPTNAARMPSTGELQIGAALRTAPMLSIAGALICLATVYCMWSAVPHFWLVMWAVLTLTSITIHVLVAHISFERRLTNQQIADVKKWIIFSSSARALCWGVGAAAFSQFADAYQLAFLCVLVIGNALGSGTALLPIPRASAFYGVLSVSPLAITMLMGSTHTHWMTGLLLIIYAFGLRAAATTIMRFVQEESELRRELVEAKLRAEAADRSKSDFLAHMSHELRTPLNAIIGFSETLSGEILGPIENKRYLEYASDINASGRHLLRLINDILDISKVEAGALILDVSEFSVLESTEAVGRFVKERCLQKRQTLEFEIAPQFPRLKTDARLFLQILLNLVTNAHKFSAAGGRIILSAHLRGDGRAVISVEDNGEGMHQCDIETALKAFGQIRNSAMESQEGTGLGLPLCDRFAKAMGGELVLQSEKGRGTKVSLILPPTVLSEMAEPHVASLSQSTAA